MYFLHLHQTLGTYPCPTSEKQKPSTKGGVIIYVSDYFTSRSEMRFLSRSTPMTRTVTC